MKAMKKLLTALLIASGIVCSCRQQNELTFTLQICTGGWNNRNYSGEQIVSRLESVISMIPVDKVIIGWNLEKEQYLEVGEFLHSRDIDMICWLPVFSEIGHLETTEESIDIWGMKPAPYNLQEGEDFTFFCPSSPVNIEAVKSIYGKYFSDCGFDGVFLDKIRTASFVAGKSGVFSCGCERCKAIYERNGFDLDALRHLPESELSPDNPLCRRFLEIKAGIISGSVAELEDWFHAQGLTVGLDLFAPSLAAIVGQDYAALSANADFVKPMMYRKTDAPAGIGFEMRAFRPDFRDGQMTEDYLVDELMKAAGSSVCPVFPGIEVNYREDIARTSPEYVSESIRAVTRAGLPGAVLAWDIMLAPDSHIISVIP